SRPFIPREVNRSTRTIRGGPMPISVCCPGCGQRSHAQESAVGKKAKCGKCSAVFIVAESVATTEPPPVVAIPPEPPSAVFPQARKPASFIPPLRNLLGWAQSLPKTSLFALAGLGAVLLIGGVVYSSLKGNFNSEKFRALNRAAKAVEG